MAFCRAENIKATLKYLIGSYIPTATALVVNDIGRSMLNRNTFPSDDLPTMATIAAIATPVTAGGFRFIKYHADVLESNLRSAGINIYDDEHKRSFIKYGLGGAAIGTAGGTTGALIVSGITGAAINPMSVLYATAMMAPGTIPLGVIVGLLLYSKNVRNKINESVELGNSDLLRTMDKDSFDEKSIGTYSLHQDSSQTVSADQPSNRWGCGLFSTSSAAAQSASSTISRLKNWCGF